MLSLILEWAKLYITKFGMDMVHREVVLDFR